ncbi:flagellar motor protein PomA [Ketobacter sp. MCCC 1A13808]|uniref:flagellar motor protein PomA n=1 Tax=Ketobacter sp. MCCC 1A13808 TaxID=2602738 RepID=UPI000F253A22|nr:flagellar motor protein PomA [Ketobacter sp. MCCC 1A13808]MVF11384.1 flagellar motor protein PomA [Ketobacter sp. MCCC 1A13808]RLP54674.1 MAG: flagellar motor protein PomA [Ketobacter sp.]
MDLATLIGLVGALVIVVMAMVTGGDVMVFVNLPSILIVVGGTFFAVMAKYSLGQFLGAIKIMNKSFKTKIASPEEIILEVVELADAARKGGLLALEGKEVSNEFLQKGIQLLVDGHDPEVVKSILSKDRQETASRHTLGKTIFVNIGDTAPAMGMIGTLVGLVQMLSAMDDPKAIGPSMAVALLTTLYGAMIANMWALPVADKVGLRAEEEGRVSAMIIDALLAIQAGQNPRVIQELLKTYLPAYKRVGEAEEQ